MLNMNVLVMYPCHQHKYFSVEHEHDITSLVLVTFVFGTFHFTIYLISMLLCLI